MREVKVTVDQDGNTQTDFSGFVGPSCLDAAAKLRQLLLERYGIQLEQTHFAAKPELQLTALTDQTGNEQKPQAHSEGH